MSTPAGNLIGRHSWTSGTGGQAELTAGDRGTIAGRCPFLNRPAREGETVGERSAEGQVHALRSGAPSPREDRGEGEDQAAFLRLARTWATVEPISDGLGAMVTPAALRISTFSAADSPNDDTMAPAWPIRRPLGAERPAM